MPSNIEISGVSADGDVMGGKISKTGVEDVSDILSEATKFWSEIGLDYMQ